MNRYKTIITVCSLLLLAFSLKGMAQGSPITIVDTPADARASAMGGFSLLGTDRNYLYVNPGAIFQNDAKLTMTAGGLLFPKVEGPKGRLINGMLSAGWRFHDRHAVFVGARYQGGLTFSVNSEQFGKGGNTTTEVKPTEYTVDLGYSYKLNEKFSAFATASFFQGYTGRTAYAALFGVGANFRTDLEVCRFPSKLNVAFRIADFGSPIYYKRSESYSLPSKVELAGDLGIDFNDRHRLTLALGTRYFFLPSDAKIFNANLGAEYQLMQLLSFRAGYQYSSKHNAFWSVGMGVKYRSAKLDLAFLKGKNDVIGNRMMATVSLDF